MAQKNQKQKKAILKALEENTGVITIACKNVGIPRRTFYNWLEEDKKFKKNVKEAIKEGKKTRIDLARAQHILKLKNGEDRAVYFELGRRDPDYILKQQIKGKLKVTGELDQKLRTDPILKKAVKFYEEELKKKYRKRDNSRERAGVDRRRKNKK